MKIEKCNQSFQPMKLTYNEASIREGVYQFDPTSLVGTGNAGQAVYLIVSTEAHISIFIYNENDRTLYVPQASLSGFYFIRTEKKVCFELKD